MSKILASIADAERSVAGVRGQHARQVTERAEAARAEHAEIVAILKEARNVLWYAGREQAVAKLDSLLSRVGGGA